MNKKTIQDYIERKRAKNPTSETPQTPNTYDGAFTSSRSSSRRSSLAESRKFVAVVCNSGAAECAMRQRKKGLWVRALLAGFSGEAVTPRCWWLGCWCKTRRAALDGSPSARSRGRGEEAWPVLGSHSAWACRWCARHRCASRQWFGCRRASRRGSRWDRNSAASPQIWPLARWIWTAPAATWTAAWRPSRPGRWRCRRCRQSVAERWRHCQTHSSYSSSTGQGDKVKVKPFFSVVVLHVRAVFMSQQRKLSKLAQPKNKLL